jgi:hypothetical protein
MRKTQNQKNQDTADLYVAIPLQLKRDVHALGVKQGKSLAEIVTDLLKSALEQQPKQTA